MECNKKRQIIVSGYGHSDIDSHSETIALYSINDTLKVENKVWCDTITTPSYLCTYQDMCFAIREEKESGSVLCYKWIDEKYILQDERILDGEDLCHIVYQPNNQTLYCSFYGTGHIAAIRVENYHFTKVLNLFQVKPSDSEVTRMHCASLEPQGDRVLATNIATDRIYIYDTKEGVLAPNKSLEYIQLKKGIGPRHLKFHPLQNYLYVITEYSNEIDTFLYDKEEPKLTFIQSISTLPDKFEGTSYGSSIDISKDGKFLYAANRGADTIAVFEIGSNGTLNKIQDASCGGNYPRHIALTKDDSCLMIANQQSNNIVFLQVDKCKQECTGMLSEVISKLPFAAPSYVQEI